MSDKTSIWVVKAPVVVVVGGLFVAGEVVSFDFGQIEIGHKNASDFLSVSEQHMNTVVVSHEVGDSCCVCVHLFV